MSTDHAGHAGQADETDVSEMFTAGFWDARYGTADRIWSGNPNPLLVEHVADLAPGEALDVGAGEGADAIWLASQGWQVTGIDISTVALARAATQAAAVGEDVAARITWQMADVLTWDPAPRQFDLISVQFMHLPRADLHVLHRRLAGAVRPRGTLLVVSHHPSDLDTVIRRPRLPDLFATAEQMAEALEAADWDIVTAAPGREVTDPDGNVVTIHDAVLRATRRR